MGWSGGTFTRVHDWTTDEGSAIDIEADRMDAEDDNFAAGINACIHKGGTNEPTANLPMGGYRHTGVDDAAALTDYASAADIIDQHLVYYTDTGSANARVITPSPAITAYAAGQKFAFKSASANTATTTLNVNALGTKTIRSASGNVLVSGELQTDGIYEVCYDGTYFQLMSPAAGEFAEEGKYANQNETKSSDTTLADHAYGLTGFSLAAARTHKFEACIALNSGGGGIKFGLDFTNAPVRGSWGLWCAQDGNTTVLGDSEAGTSFSTIQCIPTQSWATIMIQGYIWANVTTGGTVDLQWAQATSDASNSIIYAGSWMRIKRVAGA